MTENLDTTTSGGQLIFQVSASLAQFERLISSKRIVAGQRAARAQGRVPGRQYALTSEDLQKLRSLLKTEGVSVAR